MTYYTPPQEYPDVDADADIVCPYCKDPLEGMHVHKMDTEWDELRRYDYVESWECGGCDGVFTEDTAISINGVIEDEETDEPTRALYIKARHYLNSWRSA